MIAEIVATGEEIRRGDLIDSNSAYVAARLGENGVAVSRHVSIGDDLEYLVEVFLEISDRADVAVVTGGLGPTADDLTAEAAAKAAGVELKLDPSALESVEIFFKERRRVMNPASRKQAYLPVGAKCLANSIGTAPGFCLQIGKCLFFFLPGVPCEMRRMLSDAVLPQIGNYREGNHHYLRSRTLSTFGLTESQTFERLAELEKVFPHVSLGLQVTFPTIQVKLYTSGIREKSLNADLSAAVSWVAKKMGNKLVSRQGDAIEDVVGRLLRETNASLALAESCTGGLLADMITGVPGSSDYFIFSGITYSNQAKMDILRVSEDTIRRHGAVHPQTAIEMARGTRDIAGASYAVSTSGIAGPGGGTPDKPVGTVCIGLATPEDTRGYRFHFWYGDRIMHKQIFAAAALEVLRRELLGLGPPRFKNLVQKRI